MNIFFLNKTAKETAKEHCDKHVVKMIVESAQLLSTSSRLSGLPQGYKLTHTHHPHVKWLLESLDNWRWVRAMSLYLCKEYTYRYGKIHKTQHVLVSLQEPPIKNIGITMPPLCMPEECKIEGDVISSYRNYYIMKKKYMATWKRRSVPEWFIREDPYYRGD